MDEGVWGPVKDKTRREDGEAMKAAKHGNATLKTES
jgi:hypothetical protein